MMTIDIKSFKLYYRALKMKLNNPFLKYSHLLVKKNVNAEQKHLFSFLYLWNEQGHDL